MKEEPMSKRYRVPIYRVELVRESGLWASEKEVTTPTIAAEIARAYLDGVDREHFLAMFLDGRNKVIGLHTVSIGTLTGAMCHPRETMKGAILANANSIILVHNHPSGDSRPSPDDIELFTRMREAGHLLGIRVHNAIIIGYREAYSWTSGCSFHLSS
jgi:DNA repair protein RadC